MVKILRWRLDVVVRVVSGRPLGCNEMIGHATATPLHSWHCNTARIHKGSVRSFPAQSGAQTYPNVNNGELHNQTQGCVSNFNNGVDLIFDIWSIGYLHHQSIFCRYYLFISICSVDIAVWSWVRMWPPLWCTVWQTCQSSSSSSSSVNPNDVHMSDLSECNCNMFTLRMTHGSGTRQ